MSDPEPLTWAELDQLADWTEGLLTGPDANHITHLIATDPRWTHAHRALTLAQPALRTALHTAANALDAGPIPPDIAARIDHTLTHPPTAHHRSPGRARPGSRPPGRPQRARRRAALVAAATALVLIGGVGGIAALLHFGGAGSTVDSAAPPADAESPDEGSLPTVAPGGGEGAATFFASGTDYRLETLSLVAQLAPSSRVELDAPGFTAGQRYEGVATAEGFGTCVDAVLGRHPGRVLVADFAQYEGSPAVILRIGQQSGSVVVAVGPECGRDGDPHELASVALP